MVEPADIRERLFKTRRLLMAASVVLLGHYALGIQAESDAETLGLKSQVPNVTKVWAAIWLVWGWAFWTYLQHIRDLGLEDFPVDYYKDARAKLLRWVDTRKLPSHAPPPVDPMTMHGQSEIAAALVEWR